MKQACASAIVLSALLTAIAAGQTAPAFETADVHVASKGETPRYGDFVPGGRYEVRAVTMLTLIAMAYGIDGDEKILGGPGWLDTDKFDIIAKVPKGVKEDAFQPMLQALLADRFSLAIHPDTKPLPVFVLTKGKKPLLKKSSGEGDAQCKSDRADGLITLTCTNMTVERFAQRLNMAAAGYFNHRLLDKTGLTGTYDFTIHWNGRNAALAAKPGEDPPPPISAFDAVDKQLGLKAEPAQEPTPVIVVDHANETPTENAPGLTKTLPPVPTEFEVAAIKLSKPDTKQGGTVNPGRVEVFGITMKEMLNFAYDVEENRITGGPKWMDTEHYDLVAKTPQPTPVDDMRVMVRNLIEKKFNLTFHNGEQPMPVFALTLGKPTAKLRDADPANRSKCTRTPGSGIVTFDCKNTTMEQLAEKLQGAAPGYVTDPVVDLTNLKGAFDFAIVWTPSQLLGDNAARSGAVPTDASTPNGSVSFFEAVKQLGLKLEPQKHPESVMIIDHIDRLPADQ